MAVKLKSTWSLKFDPETLSPQQRDFMNAGTRKFLPNIKHVGFGGARGGGKSYVLRMKFVLLCFNYQNFRALLLRRTMGELRENHIIPLRELLFGICTYNVTENVFIFPNGSRLKLGYCDKEADVLQYRGQEYDAIGMEEATHFTEYQQMMLVTCNRNAKSYYKPKMYYTANPGGVGHHWYKRLFVDRLYTEKENPNEYLFIQSNVYDNKVLMAASPEYVKSLEALPEKQRKIHLLGDWNVLEGQYFEEFSQAKHVIEPFEIPDTWLRFRSIDWGYNDPCAIYWHTVQPGSGRVFTYRESYFNQTVATQAAKLTIENSILPDGTAEQIRYTVASPDMWQNRGQGVSSETIASLWNEVFGPENPLIKAKNERIQGWHRMHEWLSLAPDKKPFWQIFNTCTELIRTLPALIHDEHRVEDVSSKAEDHGPESCRYGFMSRPRPLRDEIAILPAGGVYRLSELRMKGFTPSQIRKIEMQGTVKIIK